MKYGAWCLGILVVIIEREFRVKLKKRLCGLRLGKDLL